MAIALTSATPIATPMQSSDATTNVGRVMVETAATRIRRTAPTHAIEVIEVIEVIAGKVTMPRESRAVIDHRSDGAGPIPEMPNKLFDQ